MPQFVSKHLNLRLTRRPHVEVATATGAYRTVEKPLRYNFAPDGVLDVEAGQDMVADGAPLRDPETGDFKRDQFGQVLFEMQDALAWLRSCPEYNNAEMIGGFTEVGREPERIPDSGPRIREIIAAMTQLDVAQLLAYGEEEEAAPYERPAVDAALAEAFAQVQAAGEALDQQGGADDDGDGGGTPEYAAQGHPTEAELDAIDKMADLVAIGERLGLELGKPGQSKEQAKALILERLQAPAAA